MLKVFNRPTGWRALAWALAFLWGSVRGRVARNAAPVPSGALCLEMTRSKLAASHPLHCFGDCLAFVWYALAEHVIRMDDTGLYIQLEHWTHDQTA